MRIYKFNMEEKLLKQRGGTPDPGAEEYYSFGNIGLVNDDMYVLRKTIIGKKESSL